MNRSLTAILLSASWCLGCDPGSSAGAGGRSSGGSGSAGADAGVDVRCVVPEGASALITVAVPALGLSCHRYPFPVVAELVDFGQIGYLIRLSGF